MQWVLNGILTFSARLRSFIGMVLPIFSDVNDLRSMGKWIRRLIHAVLLIGILILLGWANYKLKIGELIKRVDFWNYSDEFRTYGFLPILFLLIYVLSWLGYWLWNLLLTPDDVIDFPDIRDAWEEAVQALNARGVKVDEYPLFLILGQPKSGLDALMQASQLKLGVGPIPVSRQAPIRVWFCNEPQKEGIYVGCSDASLSNKFSRMLSGETDAVSQGVAQAAAESGLDKTITFDNQDETQVEIKKILQKIQAEKREPTPEEQARLRILTQPKTEKQKAVALRLTLTNELVKRYSARLRYLCRLIRQERAPFCPANGILVVLPWAGTETDQYAGEMQLNVQRDLLNLRRGLQMRCPIFALCCDFDQAKGFAEFRSSFRTEQLGQRIGQRIPLNPSINLADVPDLFDKAAQFIGSSLVPNWIYRNLRIDPEAENGPNGGRELLGSLRQNANLHALQALVFERQRRLGMVMKNAFCGDPRTREGSELTEGAPMFGGCYVAGTADETNGQAFVKGVFNRLTDEQEKVSWTSPAREEEGRYRSLTSICYTGVLVTFLGLSALCYFLYNAKQG